METIILLVLSTFIFAETTFLFVRKLREKRLKVARGSLLIDTSALMDGRIVDVAKSGIITAELIIPRSVLREMQLLADKADSDKRARARTGLENAKIIEGLETVSATVVNDGYVDKGGVDERLLELAKNYSASIATTDFNLNKVAKAVGITVVNVNELAQILRSKVLPGETAEIQLLQAGANREQAVGYLDDGTMVVVEGAKNQIGHRVKVEIIRSLQTEAGRMIFAKKAHEQATNFHSDQMKKSDSRRGSHSSRGQSRDAKHDKNQNQSRSTKRDENSQQPQQSAQSHERKSARNSGERAKTERTPARENAPEQSAKPKRAPRRRTNKSAESAMVALANKQK